MAFFSFLSWFRPWWKSTETDFETVLARLSKDIAAVQTRLTRVHTRQRRATVTLTIYAFVVWALYAAVIWFLDPWGAQQAGGGERDEKEEEGSTLSSQQTRWLFGWGPVLAGPIVILSTRRVVSWWYRRIADGEEKHLRSLQRTRRKKVDEIKLATRYDHLKMLLEKYDDTNPRNAAAANSKAGQAQMQAQQRQQTQPAGGLQGSSGGRQGPVRDVRQFQGKIDGRPLERGGSASSSQQVQFPHSQNQPQQPQQVLQQQAKSNAPVPTTGSAQAPAQQVPYQKTFLDRLADVMLGADPSSTAGGASNAAEQRYALICHICFNHNGLCHRDQWDEVQYICPRCGTFNTNRPSTVPVSSPWASSPPSSNRLRTQSSLSNFGQTREKAQDGRHQNRASLGNLPSESSSSHLLAPSGSPLRQDLGQGAEGDDGRVATEDAEEASDSPTTALAGDSTKHADETEENVASTLRSRATRSRGERPSSPVMDVD